MMNCRRCGFHRPGVNDKGLCPSCIRFTGEDSLQEAKKVSPSIASSDRALSDLGSMVSDLYRQREAVDAERKANALRYGCPVCGRPSGSDTYFLCDEHFNFAAKCIRDAGVQDLAKIKATLRRMIAPPSWADEDWVAEQFRAAAFRIKFSGATGTKSDVATSTFPLRNKEVISQAVMAIPLPKEALVLAGLLADEGFPELADAVKARRVPELDDDEKEIVRTYSQRVRVDAPTKLDPTTVQNALLQVTTSGWGKEPETTLPGSIQPLMQLD